MRRPLNMTPEERRKYNNEMHAKQAKNRRKRAEREALIEVIWEIVSTFEKLGWEKMDLAVGVDEKMVAAVADELMENESFKITLGSKVGIRRK